MLLHSLTKVLHSLAKLLHSSDAFCVCVDYLHVFLQSVEPPHLWYASLGT